MNAPWFRYASAVGWVLTILVSAALTMSAVMKLTKADEVVKQMTGHLGYPENSIVPIGVVELACVAVYSYPPTSIFGAALISAYLGGACASHVRIGEGVVPQVIMGVVAWLGLVLRKPGILRSALGLKEPA